MRSYNIVVMYSPDAKFEEVFSLKLINLQSFKATPDNQKQRFKISV